MNYNSALKSWGATGTEYPDAYSYKKDESPVDEWDNFKSYNLIKDTEHLIDVTNNDLLLRNGGSLLSDLAVGDYGLTGTAGSIDFGGTEITVGGTLDVLQSLDVGGNITISAGNTIDGVDLSAFKTDYDAHNHDGRYYTETESDGRFINDGDAVPHAVYATEGDVPILEVGETVVVGGNLYIEDGN